MRHLALLAAGFIVAGAGGSAVALPAAKSGIEKSSQIQLVQDRTERKDTVKNRVKRAWKDLTGYKFEVACPGFWMPINQSTCTESGKNREAARSKCEAQHVLCQVRDASRTGPQSRRRSMSSVSSGTVASR